MYTIKSFDVNETTGRHENQELICKNIPTEERAISWLKSIHETALVNTKGFHVTDVSNWVFNILRSEAKGDVVKRCFHIEYKEDEKDEDILLECDFEPAGDE